MGIYLAVGKGGTFKIPVFQDGVQSPGSSESLPEGQSIKERTLQLDREGSVPAMLPPGSTSERATLGDPFSCLRENDGVSSRQLVLTNSDVSENGELTVHIIDVTNFNLQNFIQSSISPRISVLETLLAQTAQGSSFDGSLENDDIGELYGAVYWSDKPDESNDPDFLVKKELDYIYQLLNAVEMATTDTHTAHIFHKLKKFAQTNDHVMIGGAENLDSSVAKNRATSLKSILEKLAAQEYHADCLAADIFDLLPVNNLANLTELLSHTGLAIVLNDDEVQIRDCLAAADEELASLVLNVVSNAAEHGGRVIPMLKVVSAIDTIRIYVFDGADPIDADVVAKIAAGDKVTTKNNNRGGLGYLTAASKVAKLGRNYNCVVSQVWCGRDGSQIESAILGKIVVSQGDRIHLSIPAGYSKAVVVEASLRAS